MAADRGARIAGIDATGPLVEIARERVPDGDFRVGDMEDLPWDDESFDVVTGFNSFSSRPTWCARSARYGVWPDPGRAWR